MASVLATIASTLALIFVVTASDGSKRVLCRAATQAECSTFGSRYDPSRFVIKPVSAGLQPIGDLQHEVDRYGGGLTAHVREVLIVRSMLRDGRPIAGTYIDSTVFCATHTGETHRASNEQLRSTVHHEISSLVLIVANDGIPTASWNKAGECVLSRFADGDYPIESWDPSPDGRLWSSGFYSPYSSLSVEEDVNTLWAAIMTHGDLIVDAVESSPLLRAKAILLIDEMRRRFPALDLDPTLLEAIGR